MVVSAKKLPLLPADSLGIRFCEIFNHPWKSIITPVSKPGESAQWRTNRYPLQPRDIWRLYNDPNQILGLRFGEQTRYALLDIDRDSSCHPDNNPEKFRAVLHAVEDIGLCRYLIVRSSHSQGLHIYFFFKEPVSTFGLACALKFVLLDNKFQIKQGELEIFPNVKPYNSGKPSNYNGHRLPLQTGSYLLDDDLNVITNDISQFLDFAAQVAAGQDLDQLMLAIGLAEQRQKQKNRHSTSSSAQQWQQDLEHRIASGWTGKGQTNELLQNMVCYGIVFLGLSSDALIDYVVNTAQSAPGYQEYCSHTHEIRGRATQWVNCTEANQFYSKYCTYPERLVTYAENFNQGAATANNIVPFATNPVNDQRRAQAQERIKSAIAHLESLGELPAQVGARAKTIIATAKKLTGVTISNSTLYKESYLPLWHPKFSTQKCVEVEQQAISAIDTQLSNTHFTSSENLINLSEPLPVQDSTENYTPPPPMKVSFELVSAPDAPQGHLGSVELFNQGGCGGEFLAPPAPSFPTAADVSATTDAPVEKTADHSLSPDATAGADSAVDPKKQWHLAGIRLEATNKASKQVKRQSFIAGKLFSREERLFREALAKNQFLWRSEEPILVAEVKAWVEATPGVVLMDDGPVLLDEVSAEFGEESLAADDSASFNASQPLVSEQKESILDSQENSIVDNEYPADEILEVDDAIWEQIAECMAAEEAQ